MDYYDELGVTPQAEPDVIRAAYRVLAKRYHPDRQEGSVLTAADKMARLNRAYEVLGQSHSRHVYDRERLHLQTGLMKPLVHRRSVHEWSPNTLPFLTTYDQRGRLHAYI